MSSKSSNNCFFCCCCRLLLLVLAVKQNDTQVAAANQVTTVTETTILSWCHVIGRGLARTAAGERNELSRNYSKAEQCSAATSDPLGNLHYWLSDMSKLHSTKV
jgi:hypothetical protein